MEGPGGFDSRRRAPAMDSMMVRRTQKLKPTARTVYDKARSISVSLQHVGGHPRSAKLVDPDYLRCLYELADSIRALAPALPKMKRELLIPTSRVLELQIQEIDQLESAQDYWRTDKEIEELRRVDSIERLWVADGDPGSKRRRGTTREGEE